MLAYYVEEVRRKGSRWRVTNVVAPCGVSESDFNCQKSIAETVVESVISQHPSELADAIITVEYPGATIKVAPKHSMFSDVYPTENTSITVNVGEDSDDQSIS